MKSARHVVPAAALSLLQPVRIVDDSGGGAGGGWMIHVVFDLEATCWRKGTTPRRMETIEIGAARLEPGTYEISETFGTFVKPVEEPVLSGFCRELTSIGQADVDEAPMFLEAFRDFIRWAGDGEITFCTWGAWDMRQIAADCRRHDIETPAVMRNHINLKAVFAELRDRKPCGMKRALNVLGLPLKGIHHRGADDAVNIARIAKVILPEYYMKRVDAGAAGPAGAGP